MNDSLRQISNLILAPMMWVCSSLGFIFPSARSPAEMSDTNTSLLVPSGIAFSIWLPIFALCITYGIIQALPKNKTRAIYRTIGPWSAAGFVGVCLWGIVNAFAPMTETFDWAQWGTAVVFVPTMLLLVKAMMLVTDHKEKLSGLERYAAFGGLSMIAGWCSIAVFLNWTPQMVALMTGAGIGVQIANVAMLSLALLWAVFIIRKSSANRIYAFPIIWGLAFVVLKRATVEPTHMIVLVAAAIGIAVLITALVIKPKASL